MEKELSDKLKNDGQILMSGFKKIAKALPNWKVKEMPDKHIIINDHWDIICYFINFEHIEVILSFQGDEIMTLKHLEKYSTTVSIVLEYINRS